MSKIDVATNYAKALYGLSKENQSSEKILHELHALKEAVSSLNENVYFSEDDINGFVKKFNFSPELSVALKLMGINGRFSIMPLLHEEFQSLLDADMNVVRGVVTSADVLSSEQKALIEAYVNKTTNKKAILTYREDPAVLGGFIVNVGSMKMDGSLKNQLELMTNHINNGEL